MGDSNAPGRIENGTHYIFTPCLNENRRDEMVVCVHGIGSYSEQFLGVSETLITAGYSVLRYDLMGRGYSTYPTDNIFDENAHIKQLHDLTQHLHLNDNGKKFHIIGHSMGGALSALYVNRYPSDIASVTLLAPAGVANVGVIKCLLSCSCIQGLVKQKLSKGQEEAWRDDYYSKEGLGLERENDCVRRLSHISAENPRQFDSMWECFKQFPLGGLQNEARLLGTYDGVQSAYTIHVLMMWAYQDKILPFTENYKRWSDNIRCGIGMNSVEEINSNTVNTINITAAKSADNKKYRVVRFINYDKLAHAFFIEGREAVEPGLLEFLNDVTST